jgi:hypothetical protein
MGHHSSQQSLNPAHFCIPPPLYSNHSHFDPLVVLLAPSLMLSTSLTELIVAEQAVAFALVLPKNSSISREREREAWR